MRKLVLNRRLQPLQIGELPFPRALSFLDSTPVIQTGQTFRDDRRRVLAAGHGARKLSGNAGSALVPAPEIVAFAVGWIERRGSSRSPIARHRQRRSNPALLPSPTAARFGLNGAMPMRASSSARSFSGWPAWPLTQCQVTLWRVRASSSACQSSAFFTGFLSAVFQPFLFQPSIQLGDAVHDIFAVGVEIDRAGLLQRLQRRDRGHQLHAVVGRLGLAAGQFLGRAVVAQDRAPAAGPGIARAGAVGEDFDAASSSESIFRGRADLRGGSAACGYTRADRASAPARRRGWSASRRAASA